MVKVKDLVMHNGRLALVVRVKAGEAPTADLVYFLDQPIEVSGKYQPRSNTTLVTIPPQTAMDVPVEAITNVS